MGDQGVLPWRRELADAGPTQDRRCRRPWWWRRAVAVGGVTGLALRPAPVSTAPSPSLRHRPSARPAPRTPRTALRAGTSKGRPGTKTDARTASPGRRSAGPAERRRRGRCRRRRAPPRPVCPGLRTPTRRAAPDLGRTSRTGRSRRAVGWCRATRAQLLPAAPRATIVTSSLVAVARPGPARAGRPARPGARGRSCASTAPALARAGFTEEPARGVGGVQHGRVRPRRQPASWSRSTPAAPAPTRSAPPSSIGKA